MRINKYLYTLWLYVDAHLYLSSRVLLKCLYLWKLAIFCELSRTNVVEQQVKLPVTLKFYPSI